jgi:hypothetical protein
VASGRHARERKRRNADGILSPVRDLAGTSRAGTPDPTSTRNRHNSCQGYMASVFHPASVRRETLAPKRLKQWKVRWTLKLDATIRRIFPSERDLDQGVQAMGRNPCIARTMIPHGLTAGDRECRTALESRTNPFLIRATSSNLAAPWSRNASLNFKHFRGIFTWCDQLATDLWDSNPLLTKEM